MEDHHSKEAGVSWKTSRMSKTQVRNALTMSGFLKDGEDSIPMKCAESDMEYHSHHDHYHQYYRNHQLKTEIQEFQFHG